MAKVIFEGENSGSAGYVIAFIGFGIFFFIKYGWVGLLLALVWPLWLIYQLIKLIF